MYSLHTYEEQSLTMYQLKSPDKSTSITVCPERGGIITDFVVEGQPLLYLNKVTLYDRTKNIRGGIPILFPISGQLENQEYEWEGKIYQMANHGLARTNPWKVTDTSIDYDKASITVQFSSDEETKKYYPFDFTVEFTYILKNNELTIQQKYRNDSTKSMPIYPGFHPYFLADRKSFNLESNASKYFDYNDEKEKTFNGQTDLDGLKESIVLLDATHPVSTFEVLEGHPIKIQAGPEFRYTVLWVEGDKPFVCVEPWMALTNEMNRKQELVMVDPQTELNTFLSIALIK